MDGPEPDEPISKAIWHLLHRTDVPRAIIIAAVRLLGECPWCTLPCEQVHGSLAVFRRWHPDFGVEALLARAFMLQFARIAVPSISKAERGLLTISKQIHKLLAKNFDHAGGASELYAETMASLKDAGVPEEEVADSTGTVKPTLVCKRSAAMWATLSIYEKHELLVKARARAGQKRKEAQATVAVLEERHKELLAKVEAEDEAIPVVQMSSAVLPVSALNRFESLCTDANFRNIQKVQSMRKDAISCPLPVGPTMMNALKSINVYQQPSPGMPAWATKVAYHRDDFKNTMFVHTFDAETTYWKFLYAIQSPSVYIAFSQATAIDIWMDSTETPTVLNIDSISHTKYRFEVNYADMKTGEDLIDVPIEEMKVITDVLSCGGIVAESTAFAIPLAEFLEDLPDDRGEGQRHGVRKEQPKDAVFESMMVDFPWLASWESQAIGFTGSQQQSTEASSSTDASGQILLPTVEGEDEDTKEVFVQAALDRVRDALRTMPGATSANFNTTVLGGRDMMKRKGIPFDNVCGVARDDIGKSFCKRRGVPYTWRNSYSKYGPHQPGILCRAWVHKMQWFLNEEQASERGIDTIFDASYFARYNEPSELLAEESMPLCGAHFLARLADLRAFLK